MGGYTHAVAHTLMSLLELKPSNWLRSSNIVRCTSRSPSFSLANRCKWSCVCVGGEGKVKPGEVVLLITDPRFNIITLAEVGRYKTSRGRIDE